VSSRPTAAPLAGATAVANSRSWRTAPASDSNFGTVEAGAALLAERTVEGCGTRAPAERRTSADWIFQVIDARALH
jgi:hypothetical protein